MNETQTTALGVSCERSFKIYSGVEIHFYEVSKSVRKYFFRKIELAIQFVNIPDTAIL